MEKPHALLRRPWEMGQIIYRGALSFQSSKELTPMDGSFWLNDTLTLTVCAQMKDYEQQWYVWKGFGLAWFIWEQRQHPFRGWKEFKGLLLLRFRSSQEGTLQEQLMSLLQTSSVHDYRRQFEMLSTPLRGLPSSILEAAFVNGLRSDI